MNLIIYNKPVLCPEMEHSNTDQLKDAAKVFTQDRRSTITYDSLLDLFGYSISHKIVLNVSKNIKLFELFRESECKKFLNVDKAMEVFNGVGMLVHIIELGLFGLFTPAQYTDFTGKLANNALHKIALAQFIPVNIPNKFTFVCGRLDREKEKMLQTIIGEYKYNSPFIISSISVSNRKKYDELLSLVIYAIDPDGSANVQSLIIRQFCYVMPISDLISYNLSTVEKFVEEVTKKRSGYSRVCIQWLDSISDKIQHAEREGEFRIPGTGYLADGYDPATNTIYEFHGSYWHGDPKVYAPDEFNKTTSCTFGELYQKTLKKEQIIKDLGYNLVVMWESEYNNFAAKGETEEDCGKTDVVDLVAGIEDDGKVGNKKGKITQREAAYEWLNNNPIKTCEKRTEYYRRYKQAVENPLTKYYFDSLY